jgi:alpha-1,3-mannosyl-glycoprotein beta-1,2-N-acetylglucosaminyltransferase
MAGRRIKKSANGRRSIERKALCALLIMAWSWMFGFLGVVMWHLRKSNAKSIPIVGNNPDYQSQLFKSIPIAPGNSNNNNNNPDYESPLLIFTCSRANYLSETLTDIYKYIPTSCRFGCPIIISQDGNNAEVAEVIKDFQKKFKDKGVPLLHIQHPQDLKQFSMSGKKVNTYQVLAIHYGWALKSLFHGQIDGLPTLPQRVVILEEDLHIAPDFFDYFQATSKILDEDPSLFAVSAYSDNGHMVKDPTRLLRTDFFPGLGWMMTRRLWMDELDSKWPQGYWDDWLREPEQRKDRQVIRPEVSRTFHFGSRGGASRNQFGSILQSVVLDTQVVDWKHQDLSYLEEQAYKAQYEDLIKSTQLLYTWEHAKEALKTSNVRLEYRNLKDFTQLAKRIHIMGDEKATVLRTAYHGVVETRPVGEHLLLLTPPLTQLKKNFPTL